MAGHKYLKRDEDSGSGARLSEYTIGGERLSAPNRTRNVRFFSHRDVKAVIQRECWFTDWRKPENARSGTVKKTDFRRLLFTDRYRTLRVYLIDSVDVDGEHS
jgi:hypothetical protein